MSTQRNIIPIHTGLNKSVEEVGLDGHSAALYDCVIDVIGDHAVVNRRPGLKEFWDSGEAAGIDGMFWWEEQGKMIVQCNGKSFTIDDSVGNSTTLSGTVFTAGKRVTYADFGTAVYGADQGTINKITTAAATAHTDGDAPATCSHVAFLDQYLLANLIGTGQCHRSDVGDPDAFSSNWFTAESKYDDLAAMIVENLEVYLVGKKTIEVWEDTGADSPFARVPGGYIPSGTHAPYSVIWCPAPINSLVLVDQNKSLVALNGRVTQDLSDALNRYLQKDDTILSDAAGDFIKTLGHAFYVLHLPTQDETPVLDFKNMLWSHWAYYNSTSGDYERWRGNVHAYAPAWGKALVGDRANGKVYELDPETYQDNGDAIRMLCRTGHLDRGDFGITKFCNSVHFRAKKTAPGGGSSIELVYRYRDNGETSWSNERTVELAAAAGETDYIARVNRLGRYKTRQWEIYCTENAPVALLPPIEHYEVAY